MEKITSGRYNEFSVDISREFATIRCKVWKNGFFHSEYSSTVTKVSDMKLWSQKEVGGLINWEDERIKAYAGKWLSDGSLCSVILPVLTEYGESFKIFVNSKENIIIYENSDIREAKEWAESVSGTILNWEQIT